MNLLPEQYVERSKSRARSSRIAVIIIMTLFAVATVMTHSRFFISSSLEQLLVAQSLADDALELEVDATSLEKHKEELESFLARYHTEEVIFPMAGLVSTITNLIPEEMTLEELSLDIITTEDGKGISGRIAGFAASDEVIASVVASFQSQELYDMVSMDFSRSREVRDARARGFKIGFLIDLSHDWDFSGALADAGGEE